MATITVLNKSNVPTGPFTRAQVAEKLQTGEFSLKDLAFTEGLSQWIPLRDVLAKVDAAEPPAPVPIDEPPSFTPATTAPVASPAYSYAATMQPPGHLVYGGFWLRFVAYLIDTLILSIPIVILCVILAVVLGGFATMTSAFSSSTSSSGDSSSGHEISAVVPAGIALIELVIIAGFTVMAWLYFALLESGPHQSTFGKRVMGLRVTNITGERISFAHATGRFFSKIITGLVPFAIGYIMAGVTERKQALHDLIASTLVVRK